MALGHYWVSGVPHLYADHSLTQGSFPCALFLVSLFVLGYLYLSLALQLGPVHSGIEIVL
jgi:hypothetical protein